MSAITTHVLDTARGRPAAGVGVVLWRRDAEATWVELARGVTDADGRVSDLLPAGQLAQPGEYRLSFATGAYHEASGEPTFYPRVEVTFTIRDAEQHYHVPLLLSPFAYSTYRGS